MKRRSGAQIECPSCRRTDLRWSHKPHYLNFIMALVFRDPIRCCRCGCRFYARAFTELEYEQMFGRKPREQH
jgi:C4-type Zn-finger protein